MRSVLKTSILWQWLGKSIFNIHVSSRCNLPSMSHKIWSRVMVLLFFQEQHFINDTLRSEFHKKFMQKYVK